MTARSEARSKSLDDWLVLDTETTGLGLAAEPVEIAVLDSSGVVRFHRLIRPRCPVEKEASRLHGLGGADLVSAPPFEAIKTELFQLIDLRTVVAYSAEFDRRVVEGAFLRASSRPPRVRWACALAWYSSWRGFSPSLGTACETEGLPIPRLHRALEDAKAVQRLVELIVRCKASTFVDN